MAERTLVASATNLLARGFLIVPTDRRSPGGEPVNALYAVARGILRAIAFKTPARAIAVIEAGPAPATWPALLTEQRPRLAELARTLGLHVVEVEDEIRMVGSYARAARDGGDD